jgi:hypothetical protein
MARGKWKQKKIKTYNNSNNFSNTRNHNENSMVWKKDKEKHSASKVLFQFP